MLIVNLYFSEEDEILWHLKDLYPKSGCKEGGQVTGQSEGVIESPSDTSQPCQWDIMAGKGTYIFFKVDKFEV